jgi:hypothetical protein
MVAPAAALPLRRSAFGCPLLEFPGERGRSDLECGGDLGVGQASMDRV